MYDQVCKPGQATIRKLQSLGTGVCPKRFKRKGRCFGSRGCVLTNKRIGAPPRLLLVRVVDYYQSGKQNRRSISFLDDPNNSLSKLGRTVG